MSDVSRRSSRRTLAEVDFDLGKDIAQPTVPQGPVDFDLASDIGIDNVPPELVNKKYESANADLRAALEDLVTRLAEDHAGYQRTVDKATGKPKANQGGLAVRHLLDGSHLPEKDGGRLLDGLWSMTHTNGSHPGQSDAEEARFRMQVVTAVARFLLKHFPATP